MGSRIKCDVCTKDITNTALVRYIHRATLVLPGRKGYFLCKSCAAGLDSYIATARAQSRRK